MKETPIDRCAGVRPVAVFSRSLWQHAFKLHGVDDTEFLALPTLGEHMDTVLTAWLGMSSAQVAQLRQQGVI